MRPEKQYLVEELNSHLDKSDYVYLTNYERITVEEIAELRAQLSEHDAEFHVVKNSIFGVAAASKDLPDMGEHLTGQTAIIVGGNNPSGVAKVIGEFFKKKDKVEMKAGIVNERALTKEEIEALAK
ncbi:MAG: 50S ribosomal protein L10, partial [Opitutales bacterium]|nr:50S ribosomal protein L10 [Opitutales bacterium]